VRNSSEKRSLLIAAAPQCIDPVGENFIIRRFQVEELNSEADARFHDPHDNQGLEELSFP